MADEGHGVSMMLMAVFEDEVKRDSQIQMVTVDYCIRQKEGTGRIHVLIGKRYQ